MTRVQGPEEGLGTPDAGIPAPPRAPNPASTFVEARARAVLLWLSRQQRLQRLTAEFGPARRMARRFVAGETREDAIATVAALQRDGLVATVAFLGEHTTVAEEARAAAQECGAVLRALAAAGLQPNCSLKLTQLGLQIDPGLAESCLREVLDVADEVNGFVRIDMEESSLVDVTLDMFERVRAGREAGRVGVVIQSYLRRAPEDVRRLIEIGAPVRLVKGAYAEPASVAFPDKPDVDSAFVRLATTLLGPEARERSVAPAFATHDPAMLRAVRAVVRGAHIPADGYEFQMLLGVRRDMQLRLARAGVRVRVYVPYGSQWYPYLMRRLAERPANALFLLRNLAR